MLSSLCLGQAHPGPQPLGPVYSKLLPCPSSHCRPWGAAPAVSPARHLCPPRALGPRPLPRDSGLASVRPSPGPSGTLTAEVGAPPVLRLAPRVGTLARVFSKGGARAAGATAQVLDTGGHVRTGIHQAAALSEGRAQQGAVADAVLGVTEVGHTLPQVQGCRGPQPAAVTQARVPPSSPVVLSSTRPSVCPSLPPIHPSTPPWNLPLQRAEWCVALGVTHDPGRPARPGLQDTLWGTQERCPLTPGGCPDRGGAC